MVCIVSRHASLVQHLWAWFVLFDYELHWFFLTWYGLYFFTSCFIYFSLPSMDWVVSHHASPVHPYWACFGLFHVILHWFIITWHGLYCFTSCFGVYSNKETMPSNDEPVKHEVKQYKPCQVMMNQWNMT
jgi:hypothetical protein